MNKIIKTLFTFLLVIPCALFLVACDKNDSSSTRAMSISTNPSATFTVDSNDKIVSVAFDNADAGRIFANINFVGMQAEGAIDTFVEVSAITGHLNFSTANNFLITINGENIKSNQKLEKTIKDAITSSCSELGIDDINFDVKDAQESIDDLVSKINMLAPQYSEEELKAMAETNMTEFIELAKETQTKFAGLCYNQIDEILSQFTSLQGVKRAILTAIESARTTLDNLETTINNYPATVQPTIQTQIDNAKIQLDEAIRRLEEEIDSLAEQAVSQATSAKEQLKSLAESEVDSFKATPSFAGLTTVQQEKLNSLIESYFPNVA